MGNVQGPVMVPISLDTKPAKKKLDEAKSLLGKLGERAGDALGAGLNRGMNMLKNQMLGVLKDVASAGAAAIGLNRNPITRELRVQSGVEAEAAEAMAATEYTMTREQLKEFIETITPYVQRRIEGELLAEQVAAQKKFGY